MVGKLQPKSKFCVDDNEYTLEEVENRRNKKLGTTSAFDPVDQTKTSQATDFMDGMGHRNGIVKYRIPGNHNRSNHSQSSDNKSKEPAIHSTSQFVAQPEMEPTFIPCNLLG